MAFDTRETLDPAWEKLAKKRSELVWDVRYCELVAGGVEGAKWTLSQWEKDHAEEWNRLKPWYEARI